MPGQSTTRLVVGDTDRNLACCWSQAGGLDAAGPFDLTGPGGTVSVARVFLPVDTEGWKDAFHACFRIPDGSVPGSYTLDAGGPTFNFTAILAPARRNVKSLGAGATPAAVTRALATGDVRLAPGLYDWTGLAPVSVPYAPRTIHAHGAHIVGGGPPAGSDITCLLFGGRDLTLDGGLWEPGGFVCHTPAPSGGNDAGRGFVFKRLTVRGGYGLTDLFTGLEEILVRDVDFDCAANLAPAAGLWLRPRFIGRGLDNAFRRASTTAGNMAIIDATFRETARGLIFQTTGAAVTDNLIAGLRCHGVDSANGSEILLAEGTGGWHRNIVFTAKGHSCTGYFPNLDCPADDNLFQDFWIDSPAGAVLWGSTGRPQARNRFIGGEWHGPVIFGPLATASQLQVLGIHYPGPSRGNQTSSEVGYYDNAATACLTALGPDAATHTATDCRMFPGTNIDPVSGAVTLSGCRVHGTIIPNGPWSGP